MYILASTREPPSERLIVISTLQKGNGPYWGLFWLESFKGKLLDPGWRQGKGEWS